MIKKRRFTNVHRIVKLVFVHLDFQEVDMNDFKGASLKALLEYGEKICGNESKNWFRVALEHYDVEVTI